MKIQNLEQFLQQRGLNYKVVVGPRWEKEGAKGKASEDRFYVINSSLEEVKLLKSVWNKGKFSSSVQKALTEFDLHETTVIYTDDIDKAKRQILNQGQKAYDAFVIRKKRETGNSDFKTDKFSEDFQEILDEIKE